MNTFLIVLGLVLAIVVGFFAGIYYVLYALNKMSGG